MNSRRTLTLTGAILIVGLMVGLSLFPAAQASQGKWRNINPTEYTSIPDARLNSIFMINGGTGGIGAGDGWAVGNNGTVFRWDGFAWNNATIGTPCRLNSVNFGSPLSVPLNEITSSAGFIVGGNNSASLCVGPRAWFWNGNSWFNITDPVLLSSPGNLSSVFVYQVTGSAPTYSIDAVAVGTNATAGTSYFWHGTPGAGGGWTQKPVDDSHGCPLNAVTMVSTTEGWAAGYCGKIYRWIGGGWVKQFEQPGVDFFAIFMVSSTEGWAVGSGGQIAHFFSGIWSCCQTPVGLPDPKPTLRSLIFTSSSEGWAVGDAVGGASTIVHFISNSWSGLQANQVPTLRGLRGVHATGGSNVWAVGETGSILLYDGTVWGSITSPLQTNFNAVWMRGSSDGAAVGNATTTGPTIVRWDGVKWTRPQGTAATTDLWSVWELNSGEWWAVGGGPTSNFGYILHLTSMTSTSFTGVPFTVSCPGSTPNCVLRDVYGTASDNVWAVSDGGAFYLWNGAVWAGPVSVTGPVDAGTMLRSITFVGGNPNNGWAVGYWPGGPQPVIFRKDSVNNWIKWPQALGIPATVRLNAVQFWDSSHGWIAADNGWILFFDGTQWNPVFTVGTYNITAIHAVSDSEAWAVGQDTDPTKLSPVLLHWQQGFGWSTVTTANIPFTNQGKLLGMFLNSGTDGFAVGTTVGPNGLASLGMMFHLDPPGGVYSTTSTSSTPTSSTSSTTSSITSSSTSTSSSQASTSTSQTSSSATTSQLTSSASSSTSSSVSTVTVTASSSSSLTTPLVMPAVPGFPWESIAAGIIIGISVLVILRRRRRSTTT